MRHWMSFEKRWRDALLGAMIPRVEGAGLPGIEDLELADFWARFDEAAPALLRVGFRATTWVLTLLPILTLRSLRPFHRLRPPAREVFLVHANQSRRYATRQLLMTLKLVATLAYFADPKVRMRFPEVGP